MPSAVITARTTAMPISAPLSTRAMESLRIARDVSWSRPAVRATICLPARAFWRSPAMVYDGTMVLVGSGLRRAMSASLAALVVPVAVLVGLIVTLGGG